MSVILHTCVFSYLFPTGWPYPTPKKPDYIVLELELGLFAPRPQPVETIKPAPPKAVESVSRQSLAKPPLKRIIAALPKHPVQETPAVFTHQNVQHPQKSGMIPISSTPPSRQPDLESAKPFMQPGPTPTESVTGQSAGSFPSAQKASDNEIAQAKPAPAAVASASGKTSAAMLTWKGKLLARIERHKRYPKAAREFKQQGVTHLRFVMDRQGKVLSCHIEKSSGVELLDKETIALIHRAEPLPVPPEEVLGERIQLVVPVQYFLK